MVGPNDFECATCQWWHVATVRQGRRKRGQCRGDAPARGLLGGPVWPITRAGDWCRRYSGHPVLTPGAMPILQPS